MTKYILSFLLLVMFIAGCRTFKEFPERESTGAQIIHPVRAEVHFPYMKNKPFVKDTSLFLGDSLSLVVTQSAAEDRFYDSIPVLDISKDRCLDIIEVIGHELPDLYPEDFGDKKLRFKITGYHEKSNLPLKIFTAWSLGIPCLLGIPANSVSNFIEIKTEWLDESGKLISSNLSQGDCTTYIALYWGFGSDARKRSVMLAAKRALWQSVNKIPRK